MSQILKAMLAMSLVAFAGACAPKADDEEVVFVEPEPVQPEPTFNKY